MSEPTEIVKVQIVIGDFTRTFAIQRDSPIDPKVLKDIELYDISFGVLHIDNSLGEFVLLPEDAARLKNNALAKLLARAKADEKAELDEELKRLQPEKRRRKKRGAV